jgi:hypothetical protein
MKDDGEVEFIDLFDPRQPRAAKDLAKSRLSICRNCEYLDKKLVVCMQCGCFMKLKTTLENATCPVHKW